MIFRDTLALTGTEIIGGVVVFLSISETAYLILEGMILSILTMNWNQSSLKLIKNTFMTNSNVIIAVTYRMPDSSVEIFNERISDILNTIQREKKIFNLIGDLNIDFLKSDAYIFTNSLIDVLYSNNVFPS